MTGLTKQQKVRAALYGALGVVTALLVVALMLVSYWTYQRALMGEAAFNFLNQKLNPANQAAAPAGPPIPVPEKK